MMPLSSAHRPASAICRARCAPSSIKPADLGIRGALRQTRQRIQLYRAPAAVRSRRLPSTWTTLAHHGMVIVPIGYGAQELFDISQVWRYAVRRNHHCRGWLTSAKQ